MLARWPSWRDKLIVELRNRDVPGDAIGDILGEAESHLVDSGESPDVAFGEPKTYARERAASIAATPDDASDTLVSAIGGAIGGVVLGLGAWGLGAGEPAPGGIPAWVALFVGVAILSFVFLWITPDFITDPRTGRPLDSILSLWTILIVGFGGMTAIVALMGWFLAR
jgi:hypothetical protein